MYKYKGERSVEKFDIFVNGGYKDFEKFNIPSIYAKTLLSSIEFLPIAIGISVIFVLLGVCIFNFSGDNK